MSAFRAYYARNIRSANVTEMTPDGTTLFYRGDFVYYDTSTDTVKQCGADPTLIAALAETDYTAKDITSTGKVPLRLLQADDVIAMSSATDYSDSYIGDSLDISKASNGVWKVLTSTSAPRVLVVGGVPAAQSVDGAIWFVQILATYCQFDAVAS